MFIYVSDQFLQKCQMNTVHLATLRIGISNHSFLILKAEQPGLKSVLRKGFGKPLLSYRTLRNNYANWSYQKIFDQVKQELKDAVFYLLDEADYQGDKYYGEFIGKLTGNVTKFFG